MAWTFVNDSLCTMLSLQWEPEIIAVAVMYLAGRLCKFEIQEWTSKQTYRKWWEQFVQDVPVELLEDICHQILDLYSQGKQQIPQQPQAQEKEKVLPPVPPQPPVPPPQAQPQPQSSGPTPPAQPPPKKASPQASPPRQLKRIKKTNKPLMVITADPLGFHWSVDVLSLNKNFLTYCCICFYQVVSPKDEPKAPALLLVGNPLALLLQNRSHRPKAPVPPPPHQAPVHQPPPLPHRPPPPPPSSYIMGMSTSSSYMSGEGYQSLQSMMKTEGPSYSTMPPSYGPPIQYHPHVYPPNPPPPVPPPPATYPPPNLPPPSPAYPPPGYNHSYPPPPRMPPGHGVPPPAPPGMPPVSGMNRGGWMR
uniref:Cyclin K n=1 Tax=Lepisosteus oculatus TaxID=7918 RepID=W5MQF6_LEPOC